MNKHIFVCVFVLNVNTENESVTMQKSPMMTDVC